MFSTKGHLFLCFFSLSSITAIGYSRFNLCLFEIFCPYAKFIHVMWQFFNVNYHVVKTIVMIKLLTG